MSTVLVPPSSMSATRQVKVLVVDEQEIVQIGLRALFMSCGWVSRSFACVDPATAIEIAGRHHPQLVFVSLRQSGGSGLALAAELRVVLPHAHIVLMSEHAVVDTRSAHSHGANAVIAKTDPLAVILRTGADLVSGRAHSLGSGRNAPGLSQREGEVLEHLVRGLSNPEIAGILHMSRHTVKQHTSAVYRKLGVRNRAEAASVARDRGLVA